jgi:hypothetical protein
MPVARDQIYIATCIIMGEGEYSRTWRSLPTTACQPASGLVENGKVPRTSSSITTTRTYRSKHVDPPALARLDQAIRGVERMVKHECVVLNLVSCAIRQAGKAAAGQTVAREPEVKLYDLRSKLRASTKREA